MWQLFAHQRMWRSHPLKDRYEVVIIGAGVHGLATAYYLGKLGVIEPGALADLLLVDGDPIANIKLIEDPAKNFVVIMKDGKLFKNLVQ